MNQQILGLQATQQLQVKLKPKQGDQLSSFCQSLTGQSSYLQLNFLDINSTLIPPSSNTTINMSQSEIVFTIQLVQKGQQTASQIYDQLAGQPEAMYNITFLGNIVLIGTIYQMNFHNLDATNCWRSGIINYYFNTYHAYIQINVEPNDCAIAKNVKVQLHYKVESEDNWNYVNIPPYKLFILDPTYYNSDTNYQHMKVKHFRVTLLSYAGQADMQQEIQRLLNMVVEFQKDRSFQFRLVIFTNDNGLEQQYYYDLPEWSGVNQSCFKSQQVYLQSNDIVLDFHGPNVTCMNALAKAEYLKVTVYVNNTDTRENFQQIENAPSNYFNNSEILRIPLQPSWPINDSNITYYVYMTFCNTPDQPVLGQNVVFLDELVFHGTVQKSCITQMNLILHSNQICVNMYVNGITQNITGSNGKLQEVQVCPRFLESYKGLSSIVMLYETELHVLAKRNYTLYSYVQLPGKISTKNYFCFKEIVSNETESEIVGNLENRAITEVKMLDKLGQNLTYAYFMNEYNAYIMDTITLVLPTRNYMWIVLVCLVSITVACVFVILQVKKP